MESCANDSGIGDFVNAMAASHDGHRGLVVEHADGEAVYETMEADNDAKGVQGLLRHSYLPVTIICRCRCTVIILPINLSILIFGVI